MRCYANRKHSFVYNYDIDFALLSPHTHKPDDNYYTHSRPWISFYHTKHARSFPMKSTIANTSGPKLLKTGFLPHTKNAITFVKHIHTHTQQSIQPASQTKQFTSTRIEPRSPSEPDLTKKVYYLGVFFFSCFVSVNMPRSVRMRMLLRGSLSNTCVVYTPHECVIAWNEVQ